MNGFPIRNLIWLTINLITILVILILNLNFINKNVMSVTLIVSLIFCVIYIIKNVKFLSTTFFFYLFYFMLFYIKPISIFFFQWDFEGYTIQNMNQYILYTVLGIHLFTLGNSITRKNVQIYNKQNIEINQSRLKNVLLLLFIFSLAMISIIFVEYQTFELFNLSRNDLRLNGSALRLISNYGGYIISFMIFLVFFTKNQRSRKNLILWLLFIIMIEYVYVGAFRVRGFLIAHISALTIGYYFSYLLKNTKDMLINNFFSKIKIGVTFLSVIFIAIIFRFFRGFLDPNQNINNFSFNSEEFLKESLNGGDFGYSDVIITLFQIVPENFEFLYGQSYYRLLFIWIPRLIWQDKPVNTETIVGEWVSPDLASIGFTLPPGVHGDLYINFGLIGVLGMMIYGLLFSIIDNRISQMNILIWSVLPVCIFYFVRGGFTNSVVISLMLIILSIILSKYIFLKK